MAIRRRRQELIMALLEHLADTVTVVDDEVGVNRTLITARTLACGGLSTMIMMNVSPVVGSISLKQVDLMLRANLMPPLEIDREAWRTEACSDGYGAPPKDIPSRMEELFKAIDLCMKVHAERGTQDGTRAHTSRVRALAARLEYWLLRISPYEVENATMVKMFTVWMLLAHGEGALPYYGNWSRHRVLANQLDADAWISDHYSGLFRR